MNPNRTILLIILPVLALAVGWQLRGYSMDLPVIETHGQFDATDRDPPVASGALVGDPEQQVNAELLWNVWRMLQEKYVEPEKLNGQSMFYGAIRGLVSGVGDPYTAFMTPSENKNFHDSLDGHLQGIGAELADRDGRILVVSPIKGSPAEKAGLLPEDTILSVDGVDVIGLSLTEVVTKIRGPKGTSVTLAIARGEDPEYIDIAIMRDDITIPSVSYEVRKQNNRSIGVLAISQFGTETIHEAREIVQTIKPEEIDGLILDLRYNGGGYLDGAVDLTSMFLKEGEVVRVIGTAEEQRHTVSGRPLLGNEPLVVLINQASASASEITAGALQDHKRATIVGMKSFGKGTVQEVIDLPDGSSLRVTVAKWFTPNGRDISREGVLPDIVVNQTKEDTDAERDTQMEKAMEAVLER